MAITARILSSRMYEKAMLQKQTYIGGSNARTARPDSRAAPARLRCGVRRLEESSQVRRQEATTS